MALFLDEKECIEFLQSRGYRVTKVSSDPLEKIKSVKDLLRFYESRLVYYSPERSFLYAKNYEEDSIYLSGLVKSRERLGLGRKEALQEAAQIIDVVLKYEKTLNLKSPITSPAIFSSRSIMNWACSILNGENSKTSAVDNERAIENCNFLSNKVFSQEDFYEASKEREKIMESLNGKRK